MRTGLTSTRAFVYPSAGLGGDAAAYGYFAGLLDEVSIYNRALSANEVAAIYLAGSNGKCGIFNQPLMFDTSPTGLQWTSNGLKMRLKGLTGYSPVCIHASANLTNWTPIYTNNLPGTNPIEFLDSGATNRLHRFYRVEER